MRPPPPALSIAILATFLVWLAPASAHADTVRAAVATNFIAPAQALGAAFEAASGHRLVISSGSTGKLYAQIAHGAPFDVFLAADSTRPARAEAERLAVPGSRITYAIGKLVLYSADPTRIDADTSALRRGDYTRLAIANPDTAPYGRAAVETLHALGLYATAAPRLIRGDNIAQTYQFVATGNASLGFVALSQIIDHADGSRWRVPETLYAPIHQDAVLLARATHNPAARAFMQFLSSDAARRIVTRYGYDSQPR
ncbi:MAG: molybdate ABC transporter substrate-binding protein [Rhodocyclaceae bacterium]|nr:molybdate ABC transporter substrate-binding protein [Rhodocyclaceae bacterium]